MRIRHSDEPLPKKFLLHPSAAKFGLHAESEIFVGRSRIPAKVLWFRDRMGLRKFWREIHGSDLGSKCAAAVNSFGCECSSFDGNGNESNIHYEVDPNYFCVMGFSMKDLDKYLEIIPHEAVHAAFCYKERFKKTPWAHHEFHEEHLAYPVGEIAESLFKIVIKHKWV